MGAKQKKNKGTILTFKFILRKTWCYAWRAQATM